jgi:hypothetical protein
MEKKMDYKLTNTQVWYVLQAAKNELMDLKSAWACGTAQQKLLLAQLAANLRLCHARTDSLEIYAPGILRDIIIAKELQGRPPNRGSDDAVIAWACDAASRRMTEIIRDHK